MSTNIFNMVDIWNNGATTFNAILMNVSNGSSGSPVAAAGSLILNLQNNAATVFGVDVNGVTTLAKLLLGGATSSFPAFKRSGAVVQARLADDSAFAQIQGKLTTDTNATTGLTPGVLAATTNATITMTDGAGQLYRLPCII